MPARPYRLVMRSASQVVLSLVLPAALFSAPIAVAACGSDPPPAKEPPPATAQPSVTAAPEPTATAEPEPTATATASATAPKGSGRPPIVKSADTEIADTFGTSPAAKLELGEAAPFAVFRIPEGSLAQATNVHFKIEKTGKTTGPAVGKVYRMYAIIPPASASSKIDTNNGEPFVLALPAGNKKDANLAIGEVKGAKVEWTIVAPKKIDDATGTATFELPAIVDAYLHITTKAPSAAPEKK